MVLVVASAESSDVSPTSEDSASISQVAVSSWAWIIGHGQDRLAMNLRNLNGFVSDANDDKKGSCTVATACCLFHDTVIRRL
ncbi:hypothetical protein EAE99_005501 [Botrytis elliptica]|nr:hypothetical protein EAE99_005501 [Botrytis elliptica]